MKNDDYKSEFEEHRKEIKLEEDQTNTTIKSRTELHRKNRKPKKKNRLTIVNVIFALFILIPLLILVLVYINWDSPENKHLTADNSQVKYETIGKKSEGTALKDEKIKTDKNTSGKDNVDAQSSNNDVDEKLNETADSKPDHNTSEPDEKQEKKVVEKAEEKKLEEKDDTKTKEVEKKPETKTHIVTSKETLYSISVTYYQSGNGVDRIKQANGLTSNEIYIGQSLIIP